jgi:RNA polymerase sigma factor (sigma-70 family)
MPSVMTALLHQLGAGGFLPDDPNRTDGELLEHFLTQHEEAAFEALVRRHGPMVLGVCRRVLRNVHDAEDAFQATFLVLVHKAGSIVPRDTVGNFLYGVAYRTALKARALAARRHSKERQVRDMPQPARESAPDDRLDLQPHLDQELARLRDKYRAPLVLCDLEGKTRGEAARLLGVAEGTLSSRLARARRMLAGRLATRGVTLSASTLAVALSREATAAYLPAGLLASTTHAALRLAAGEAVADVVSAQAALLTKGVLKAMFVTKCKGVFAWVMVAALAALGAGALGHYAWAQAAEPPAPPSLEDQADEQPPAAARQVVQDDPPPKPKAERKETRVDRKRVTAKDEVTKSFTTKEAPRLVVNTFNGSVAITTGPAGTTKVKVARQARAGTKEEAEKHLKSIDVQITQEANTIRVQAKKSATERIEAGAAVEVQVPPSAQLDLQSSNGGMTISGPTGDVKASSSNGGIQAKGSKGKLHLNTSNGRITVEGGSGKLDLRTRNGSIRIQGATGVVAAQTSNGSIHFAGTLADGEQSFQTSNGRIAIELPADARFRVDARTTNGKATTQFALKESPKPEAGGRGRKFRSRNSLQGTVGDNPKIVLKLRSSNGSIEVTPAK